ncbi:MAG TPA: hypothetical protein VF980_16205 [Thermoanaerobaculia bacterium]
MHVLGSIDAVIAAIRDEANAEIEAMRVVPEARTAASPVRAGDGRERASVLHEHKRNDERLGQAEWEEKRRLIEQREAWIARVIARGNEILAKSDEATVERLVREAKQSIGRGDVAVEIATGGGCIVRCGALVVDNSFVERAKRLEPVWRKALAEMYRV